jgi:diadenosine tetraphosphate (Ap4A) HIT family hydrolase
MKSGWLVLSDQQTPRGWCILLPDPVVPDLNALNPDGRREFLIDMARAGDALLRATGAIRINYSILGNQEPALHAHIQPRYADEPPEHRKMPVWAFLSGIQPELLDPVLHGPLIHQIRQELC